MKKKQATLWPLVLNGRNQVDTGGVCVRVMAQRQTVVRGTGVTAHGVLFIVGGTPASVPRPPFSAHLLSSSGDHWAPEPPVHRLGKDKQGS